MLSLYPSETGARGSRPQARGAPHRRFAGRQESRPPLSPTPAAPPLDLSDLPLALSYSRWRHVVLESSAPNDQVLAILPCTAQPRPHGIDNPPRPLRSGQDYHLRGGPPLGERRCVLLELRLGTVGTTNPQRYKQRYKADHGRPDSVSGCDSHHLRHSTNRVVRHG